LFETGSEFLQKTDFFIIKVAVFGFILEYLITVTQREVISEDDACVECPVVTALGKKF
jgi:hypothetical protein